MEQEQQTQKEQQKESKLIPLAIVIAGVIIAGTVFYTNKGNTPTGGNVATPQGVVEGQKEGPLPISEGDHVLGNPEAPLTMFLYEDYDCFYCKKFHPSIKAMTEGHIKDGNIKLVLRHFPLDSIHPDARNKAEASECVAEIGGEDKFWQYADSMFETEESAIDLAGLAEETGVNKDEFIKCLSGGKFAEKVQTNWDDAVASGAQGTPFFLIIDQNGKKYTGEGAMPYESAQGQGLKDMIDAILELSEQE